LKPLNLQAAMYALISQLTLVCNMQLNVLDDLAEAMKALDGKKYWRLSYSAIVSISCQLHWVSNFLEYGQMEIDVTHFKCCSRLTKNQGVFFANGKLDSSLDEIPKSDPLRIKSFHSSLLQFKCFQKVPIMFGFRQKHHNFQLQNKKECNRSVGCARWVSLGLLHQKRSKVHP